MIFLGRVSKFAALTVTVVATLFATISASSQAQEIPLTECVDVTLSSRVVNVRYKPVLDAAQLVDQMIGQCGAYKVSKAMRVITVEDELTRLNLIEEAIRSWDLPPREVEISVSLILGTMDEPVESEGLVNEIRGVNRLLGEMTRWSKFTTLGAATIRAKEGGDAEVDLGDRYIAALHLEAVDLDRSIIQIKPFRLLRIGETDQSEDGVAPPPRQLLSLELNLREGKLELVGAPSRTKDKAIFLALQGWTLDDSRSAGASGAGDD